MAGANKTIPTTTKNTVRRHNRKTGRVIPESPRMGRLPATQSEHSKNQGGKPSGHIAGGTMYS